MALTTKACTRFASVVVLVAALLCSGSRSAEEVPEAPHTWHHHFAVVMIPDDRLDEVRETLSIPRESLVLVHYDRANETGTYRVPRGYAEQVDALGLERLLNPPFRFVDPFRDRRKASDKLRDWYAGYKDPEILELIMRRLELDFPDHVRLHEIGRSHSNRPILALKISDNPEREEDEPAILYVGAHHGNEPLTVDYTLDLAYFLLHGRTAYDSEENAMEKLYLDTFFSRTNAVGTTHYRTDELDRYLSDFEVWIVPCINPDGLHRFWEFNVWAGRKNDRDTTSPEGWNENDGIDLNRNYPFHWNSDSEGASSGNPSSIFYRGDRAGSEPETQALMALAEQQRFALAISYHCYATKILIPYTIDSAISPDPNPALRLGEMMAERGISYRDDRDFIPVRNLYSVDGTDQDWLYNSFGTIAFILEGSYRTPAYEPLGRLSVQGVRPMSTFLFEAYLLGPTVVVHTIDSEGEPLEAAVRIDEYSYFEGERYTTHPENGRIDLILAGPSHLTIVAEKEGYISAKQQLRCESGVCAVQLKLTSVGQP